MKQKITAIHNNTGSRFYRLIPHLKYMQEQGHEVQLIDTKDPHMLERMMWADIVIFQMVFDYDLVRRAKKAGKKVIIEMDDLLHRVPKTHYSYKELSGWGSWKWHYRALWTVWKADGFICTGKELRWKYGWFKKNALVFPNYLSLEHWLKPEKKNTTDKVRILWGGSTSHTGDLHWVKPIMKRIMDAHPQVQFIYVGHGGVPSDDLYSQFIYGEDIFEGLDTSRRESILPAPPNVFPYILASLQADIAIAPLEKKYFNKFKSQCKYLEYAVNGVAGVYSKHHYTDVKHGVTGLVADTPEEWEVALTLLINSDTMRKRIGENARKEAIENHNINKYLPIWKSFIESL